VRVVGAPARVFAAMSPVRTPSGIVALATHPRVTDAALVTPAPALVLVGVDIQDPGNVGAIVRAAEAAWATGVVFVGASADPFGWKALRGAMGAASACLSSRTPDVQPAVARTAAASGASASSPRRQERPRRSTTST
jgi:RNA methyltransferase, TrmH family